MTVKEAFKILMGEIGEVKDDLRRFRDNDFLHLTQKVDKNQEDVNTKFAKLTRIFIGILVSLILLLAGVIVNLVI